MATLLLGCAPVLVAPPAAPALASAADEDLIIVAVHDQPEANPTPGATPRARYAGASGYADSSRAAALAAEVAQTHALSEQAFWSIAAPRLRCSVFRIAPGAQREQVLARLGRDERVQLAQPMNEFETQTGATAATPEPRFNDPYLGLQRGFAAIQAGPAHALSQGDGVRVAVIDTGLDASHPDLLGRITSERDFVGSAHPATFGGERHATEVAGVIAAVSNNQIGIVGVAPQARVLAYRACWPLAQGGARCNSFTLAQALAAAIAAGSDVINLSLAGPSDALLRRLTERALAQGIVVVGAVPPGGSLVGFPADVPGVLAVVSSDDERPTPGALAAPGRDILTLEPGGSYGYASGSSLATAHVSGAVALLRAWRPSLQGQQLRALLAPGAVATGHSIELCSAMRRLEAGAACVAPP